MSKHPLRRLRQRGNGPRCGPPAALSEADVWQETNNSVDGQRSGVNITGCICKAVCLLSRRCTFGEFESMAVPSRRRWRMFKQPQCHLRLRHKISAWDSGGAAGSTRVATCLGPATPRSTTRLSLDRFSKLCIDIKNYYRDAPLTPRSQKIIFNPGTNYFESLISAAAFIVNSEPHVPANNNQRRAPRRHPLLCWPGGWQAP
jgi:hypothetical protein